MKYKVVINYDDEKFRRLTGVQKLTFHKMVTILDKAMAVKKAKGGRARKLTTEEMLLMTLEYLREYRTYFHIGSAYGVSESYAYKLIKWVEDTLIQSREFSLPSKRALYGTDLEIEVALIDATETQIQRPQKNKEISIPAKRKSTH